MKLPPTKRPHEQDPEQRKLWEEYLDGLRPARGLAYGVIGGGLIWIVIGLVVWLLW
jgi:hypothetical protein